MSRPRMLSVTTAYFTQRAFLLPYAKHFRSLGWQVDALAQGISGSEECRQAFDHVLDIDWSRNPLRADHLLRMPARVRRIVARATTIWSMSIHRWPPLLPDSPCANAGRAPESSIPPTVFISIEADRGFAMLFFELLKK